MAHDVQLSWNADPDASSGYNVYRGTASGKETTLLTASPISTTSFTDNTPVIGENFYVVKAVANGVESSPSAEVTAVILPAAPTGLTVVSSS